MFATLLVAFAAVITGDADTAAVDATAVVRRWVVAQEDVDAVHATFVCYKYDSSSRTFKKSSGEVYYSSRTNGFWSFAPDSEKDAPKTVRRGNTTYVSRVASAKRYVWNEDLVTVIDEKEKKYDQFPRNASLFGTQLFPYVTTFSPFIPGLPDKKAITDWDFTIVAETDDEVRLKATPPKALTKQFRSCELILQKPDMTLYAVRYTDPSGNRESILVFKTVKRNPEKMPAFDLSEYTVGQSVSGLLKR